MKLGLSKSLLLSQGYFGEATLDTQYVLATGENVKTWFISHEQFDLLYWCQMVLNMTTPSKVFTISWGSAESGYLYDINHVMATNTEFMKMGTVGMFFYSANPYITKCTKYSIQNIKSSYNLN